MFVRLLQLENASLPIDVTFSGILTEIRLWQESNALLLMVVTDFGNFTFLKLQ